MMVTYPSCLFSGQRLGPAEREHHPADQEERPAQGRGHQNGAGVLQVDLRRRDALQGGGDQTDRNLEDGDLRKDLRRSRAGEVDQQVGQDSGERRTDRPGCEDDAGTPGISVCCIVLPAKNTTNALRGAILKRLF